MSISLDTYPIWLPIRDYWRSSAWYDRLFALSLIFFYAFIVVDQWDWAKQGLYLATLAALTGIVRNGIKPRLTALEWLILGGIAAWLLHTLLSVYLNDIYLNGYDHFKHRQTKWLFFVPVYFYLRQRPMPLWIFWVAVFLCILVTGLDALYQFYRNGHMQRIGSGGQLALRYGAIISTMAMIAVLPISKAWRERRYLATALLGLLALLGLGAVVMAGTRGAWLAMVIFALACLGWLFWRRASMKRALLMGTLIAAGVAALYQLNYVEQRLDAINKQTAAYFSDDPGVAEKAKRTSIGTRFELWKVAWQLGSEQVWYGRGLGGFNATVNREYLERGWPEHLRSFEYPHNQYLAAWATRGLPGVVLLLLLFIIPLLFFRPWVCSPREDLQAVSIAGLILVLSFMIYNLTYDHFEKRTQIAFYATTLAVLMGMLRERTRSSAAA